jgi:hypothetical protein
MATVPEEVEAKRRTVAVLVCSACGRLFRYDKSYNVDPKRQVPGGGPAVFHTDCYQGDGTPLFQSVPFLKQPGDLTGLAEGFVSSIDKVKVYTYTGAFPLPLRHSENKD